MMYRIMILLFLIVISIGNSFAKSSSQHPNPFKSHFKTNFDNLIHPAFIYSYLNTSYYNQEFYDQLDNGSLKRKYSDEYTLRWTLYPVILDAGLNTSRYEENDSTFTILGYNFSGSLYLPHDLYIPKLIPPDTFTPYVGCGYQFYADSDADDKFETPMPFWKAGLMINLWVFHAGGIFLNAEYKQAFDTKNENNFNQYSFGIGLRGKALYYTIAAPFYVLYLITEVEYK